MIPSLTARFTHFYWLRPNRIWLPAPPEADWLDELNPYAVEARYGTIDPEGLDRTRAVQAAEQVLG